ncbi:PfkB family carbohydrate kinase [Eubacteriales bacterium OttesenSCG-928-N13]|nr:PfkB family carbohydrate kinase [Eubacteriales bacterium OttesenSCG-928-N13]
MPKKALIMGSTVADIIINLNQLPGTAEDVHVISQRTQLGGCAFNVSDIFRHADAPHLLFSPVGSGIYGDFVRDEMNRRGIERVIPDQVEENGCCYCFVESGGERTFISHRGAEYRFKTEFFDRIDPSEYGCAYVCGLEIEEPESLSMIHFLQENPKIRVYFAPGPRIMKLPAERMAALFAMGPVLHLNEREAHEYTGLPMESAALWLQHKTGADVVITLGARGAYCLPEQGEGQLVPPSSVTVVDTIGAGDAHIGALMAYRENGRALVEATSIANRVAGLVVSRRGALIDKADFDELKLS